MTVLSGAVEELRYCIPEDAELNSPRKGPAAPPAIPGVLASESPCPQLEACGGLAKLLPGETAYVSDAVALHAVRCAAGAVHPAVTLHLYAPPITRTRLFEPEADRITLRQPGFHSVCGRVLRS
jgi:hypothetical protein